MVAAGAVYPVVMSRFLSGANTDAVIPEDGVNRLLWIGITASLFGYIVGGTTARRKARAESAT